MTNTKLIRASEAKAKALANKAIKEAEWLKKAEPYLEEMVSKCSVAIQTGVNYGLTSIKVDIDNSKLNYEFTAEDAYRLVANVLEKYGYECKPICNNKRIEISWKNS